MFGPSRSRHATFRSVTSAVHSFHAAPSPTLVTGGVGKLSEAAAVNRTFAFKWPHPLTGRTTPTTNRYSFFFPPPPPPPPPTCSVSVQRPKWFQFKLCQCSCFTRQLHSLALLSCFLMPPFGFVRVCYHHTEPMCLNVAAIMFVGGVGRGGGGRREQDYRKSVVLSTLQKQTTFSKFRPSMSLWS